MAASILERLRGDTGDFKPICVWKWNDTLDASVLINQIQSLKKQGFGGFVIRPETGLKTEYLSDKWFEMVGLCIEEAKNRHMRVWIDDASDEREIIGRMGFMKDEQYHARVLRAVEAQAFDPKALGCYRVENGEIYRLTDDDGFGCLCVYEEICDDVLDALNWKSVRGFVEEAYDCYYKRFAASFGGTIKGFFTHEPWGNLKGLKYSPALRIRYKSKYSRDVLDDLGALFLDCKGAERVRYKYRLMLNELYTEAFVTQIYHWCTERNCRLSGAMGCDGDIEAQMSAGMGDLMLSEFQHISASRLASDRRIDDMAIKRASSLAMQLNKPQMLYFSPSEHQADSPKELKRLIEDKSIDGAAFICFDGMSYSLKGNRKSAGTSLNTEAWINEMKPFNTYLTRLGVLLSQSREIADALIIYPARSAYGISEGEYREKANLTDNKLNELCQALDDKAISYHFADEAILNKYANIRANKLVVGKCAYSTLIVPYTDCLDEATFSLINEFERAGGRLISLNDDAPLISGEDRGANINSNADIDSLTNPGFSLKRDSGSIKISVRRADFGDFIYAVNPEKHEQSATFHINAKGARLFKCEKPGFEPLYFKRAAQGIDIPLNLKAGESNVIFLSSLAESANKPLVKPMHTIEQPEAIIESADDNSLALDCAYLSYDGANYSEKQSIAQIAQILLDQAQNRTIYLKFEFFAGAKPQKLNLIAKKIDGCVISLNGNQIEPNESANALMFDIASKIRIGINEIILRIDYYQSEQVYFNRANGRDLPITGLDTEIDALWLKGDFCVSIENIKQTEVGNIEASGKTEITLPRKYVNMSLLREEGYPYFSGQMTLRTIFNATGDETLLRLDGAYALAKLSVNGSEEALLLWGNEMNVQGLLKNGANELRITLYAFAPDISDDCEPHVLKRFRINSIEIG